MRRLFARRPGSEIGRGVSTLVVGTGLAQVLVIATSPILTRLYSPADYGVFAVATSILSVLVTLTCLRYEYALPLPEDDATAANILGLALLLNAGLSLAAAVALWLLAPAILPVFGATALIPYVWVISVGQFGGGVVSTFTNWAVRTKAFGQIATTRLTQGFALVTAQIGLGVAGWGSVGLIVGDAAGRIAGSSRLARAAWRTHGSAFRRVTRGGMRAAAARYLRFPLYSMPSTILASFAVQAPLLALVALYGPGSGGLFALAVRLCAMPLTLVADAVGQVFVAESARLAREDPRALAGLFTRTTRSLALISVGPAALAMLGAPLLAGVVFGDAWAEAGLFVAILVPSYVMQFVIAATGDVLYVVERQDLQLIREVLRFALLGSAVPIAGALGLSALGAVAVLSAAGIVTYGLYGLISWRAIGSRLPAGVES